MTELTGGERLVSKGGCIDLPVPVKCRCFIGSAEVEIVRVAATRFGKCRRARQLPVEIGRNRIRRCAIRAGACANARPEIPSRRDVIRRAVLEFLCAARLNATAQLGRVGEHAKAVGRFVFPAHVANTGIRRTKP